MSPEDKLRSALRAEGFGYIETGVFLNVLKRNDWFINNGTIHELQYSDWMDYEDDSTKYTVWVSREEEEDE